MPVMGGIESTKKIRALSNSIHQPIIIACTAAAFEEDRLECLAAGMNYVITKPIQISLLESILEEISL